MFERLIFRDHDVIVASETETQKGKEPVPQQSSENKTDENLVTGVTRYEIDQLKEQILENGRVIDGGVHPNQNLIQILESQYGERPV